jgi:A/G-specific adenine glycosylase
MNLSKQHIQQFQNYILDWHNRYGRSALPWRETYDPYHVLVSEIMLQQTQVNRVIPKFKAFLSIFPDYATLAAASKANIIQAWQGLGYNRRGLFLQKTAQKIVADHNSIMPTTRDELLALPGIGPYTASALQAFAFNQPVVMIETNIRAIYLHHFFPGQQGTSNTQAKQAEKISDTQLLPVIEQTLWHENPRQWYSALMDYGSQLKQLLPNPSRRSSTHVKQSKFSGSFRQLRGHILRTLSNQNDKQMTYNLLAEGAPRHFSPEDVQLALKKLELEGFIEYKINQKSKETNGYYTLQE